VGENIYLIRFHYVRPRGKRKETAYVWLEPLVLFGRMGRIEFLAADFYLVRYLAQIFT
jgi:hypothetical protein